VAADPLSSLQRHRIEQSPPDAEAPVVGLSPAAELGAPAWQRDVRLIFSRRWQIVTCTVLAMLITFVCAKFLMTRWYQAVTLLRPASQEPQNSLSLGNILGSMTSGSSGPLSSIFGTTAQDAQEMLAILASVDFNAKLAERNKLVPRLMRHKPIMARLLMALTGGGRATSAWTLNQLMQSRLDCTYDDHTGNLTLTFMDPNPAEAGRILGLYVGSLQQRLRERAIASSEAAVKALQTAASKTSDALMAGQLDQLLAQQIQQLETAEVQADFAFVVIDPPTVPPMPFSPRPLIDTLAAGILTPLVFCGLLLLRERQRNLSRFFERG
jgi:uncharacterized protein involved in exopolysaccharide biosynthesis